MEVPSSPGPLHFPDWTALLSRGSFLIETLGPSNLGAFLLLSGVHNPIFPQYLPYLYPTISPFLFANNAIASS